MNLKNTVFLFAAAALVMLAPWTASSQEIDCLKCHAKVKKEKVVHPAVDMGCTTCHTGIDAVPHNKKPAVSKGLSAEQPDLCYGCHDKAMFTKKNVHPAIGMGCTACHNPHSSKNPKLLIAEVPDLCFNCHDKAGFSKKIVHAPVEAGMCLTCHNPHSSDEIALLVKKPYDLCLDCHAEVPAKPHAISGFGSSKHPLGAPIKIRKKGVQQEEPKVLMDPTRPSMPFYCGSCHHPHSSDTGRMFRFNAKSGMDLCTNCHKM